MKVSLKNVGMLDEANFEVGDLTIICGENNTGKTYATYSLYGYLDYIKQGSFLNLSLKDSEYSKLLEEVVIEDCKFEIVTQYFESILIKISHIAFDEYKEQLSEILAGKEVDFTKTEFTDDIVKMVMAVLKKVDMAKNFFSNANKFELLEIHKEKIIFDFSKSEKTFTEKMKNNLEFKKDMFVKAIISYIYNFLYPSAFIISAERTGASMFQKELDVNKSEIVEQISMADTNNIQDVAIRLLMQRYSRYPKPVKDNIYFIRGLNEVKSSTSFISKNENTLNKIILELLHKIIGGKYLVSQEGIEFAPGAKKRIIKGKVVAIQRASSSVRSLLMLNYYILYMARIGDILMIDEPELNLHPNNQILVARLLVLLANAGIKVFITTHSDYIVREISNCIMLGSLTDNQIDKFKNKGYTKEYKINHQKVKAYLAENKKGKNILSSVGINECGIFMNTFDSPIDTQNENQSLIFAALLESNKNDK